MRKQLVEQIDKIINEPHGLFLSCGPTGAGKSTTPVRRPQFDRFEREQHHHGGRPGRIQDGERARRSRSTRKRARAFGGSLRCDLRQDPDIVMIGKSATRKPPRSAARRPTPATWCFSTVHANDTITALFRIIDLGVEPFMLSTAVSEDPRPAAGAAALPALPRCLQAEPRSS